MEVSFEFQYCIHMSTTDLTEDNVDQDKKVTHRNQWDTHGNEWDNGTVMVINGTLTDI